MGENVLETAGPWSCIFVLLPGLSYCVSNLGDTGAAVQTRREQGCSGS